MESKPNPELYERMIVPFESQDEAEAALDEFVTKVAQLREQYKMPDVSLSIVLTVKNAEGEVEQLMGGASWGDNAKALMMAKRQFDRLFDYWRSVITAAGLATKG